MSIEPTGDSGPQPTDGSNFTVTSGDVYTQTGSSTTTFADAQQAIDDAPLVTEAPAADEQVITAAEDPPYQDVVSVRREGREAVLTVNGNETVLNAHDCQSLWRELSAIVPVI